MNRLHILELKVPPPVAFLLTASVVWLITRFAPWASISVPDKNGIALAVASASALFAAAAIISFLRVRTTVHPHDPHKTTVLVTTGVYRITRNPMYVALLVLLIAWVVYLANLAALMPLPLFVAYISRFQIAPEERALTSLFGDAYEDYRRRVRRWL